MLKNIVVPLDGSDYSWCAAQLAIQIAHSHRAKIHGVYSIDAKVIEGSLLTDLKVPPETAKRIYQDKGQKLLGEFGEKCRGAGVAFQPNIDVSAIADLVRKMASEVEAELIVMGKKGLNAQWTGPLLGSTAESVVRRARRPVLLTHEAYSPIKRVYVAYDGELVSIRSLRFAADLCEYCKWDMFVISVHDSEKRREELLREAKEMAELHELKIATVGRVGEVSDQILEATTGEPDALIAVGAYSSNLRRLILGSVSEEIMHRATQPVLIYRPMS